MHELSIVLGIVDIAEKECKKASAKLVDSIDLQIGRLSGVEPDALSFAWPAGVKDTSLKDASLHIDWIDGKAKCLECGHTFPLDNLYLSCPKCDSYFKDIIEGKELRVKSLTVT